MKKILLVLTVILTLGLGACSNAPDNTQELEDRIEVLEAQMLEVEQILIDIQVIEGLNGVRDYYLPNNTVDGTWQGVNASVYETLGTELDKTKSPSYILDIDENYIPFEGVAQLLIDKYFGDRVILVSASVIGEVDLRIDRLNMTQADYMARMILLIDELSNYSFYILGSTNILIQTDFLGTSYIRIPIQTLRSDFITLTPEVIYNGWYEIDVYGMSYLNSMVQGFYDSYVLSQEFSGFVLDYE